MFGLPLEFVTSLPLLINTGVATIAGIKGALAALRPGVPEAELNAICDWVEQDAARRKTLADADQKPNA